MSYLLSLCLNRVCNYYKQIDGVAFRSILSRCSVKKGVFKNFAKFAGKHMCQSLFFNKVAGLRLGTLLKKRLWHKCFLVNFAKYLRTPFLQSLSGWQLLGIGFPLGATLVKVFCFVLFLWKIWIQNWFTDFKPTVCRN